MAGSSIANGRMAARAFTAIVGGYAAAAGFVSLLARIAPVDRAEATIWAMTLSFLVYAGLLLWAFHETRLARVAVAIWGLAFGTVGILWLLGPAL
ncbi:MULTISPECIES: iron transporter [unclassified Sphingopyxis]|uniref:iron transporter n=2 Tax=unclassified Sphingopyxis TaxID=2614943 RepID=UPI0012E37889|nr:MULTISPECIES: iron transporter [unclassified Sphingopyxis]